VNWIKKENRAVCATGGNALRHNIRRDSVKGDVMFIKRLLAPVLILGVVGAVSWGIYKTGALSPEREPPHVVPTEKAHFGDIEQQVLVTGQVAPIDETEIRSEVSGLVTAVKVQPGNRVKKGDQLLQLDRRELDIEANEDGFNIAADELRVKQAKMELDRDRDLIGKGFIPQKEYDDADIAMMLAQNDLDVQRSKLDRVKQEIIKTDLRSPHDGVILKLDVREGEVIVGTNSTSSGTVLMRVANLDKLKVTTQLNEVDVVKIQVGQKVKLTFDAVPGRTLPGTVTYISPSAEDDYSSGGSSRGGSSSSRGGGSGSSVRGFETIVALDENDASIRPGITAHVAISLAKAQHAVVVPLTAVFSDDADSYSFVKKGDTFEKRSVKTGISDGMVLEIVSGLKDGDEVATERPTPLDPSAKKLPGA
jgi:HlyD family secretion protein